MRRLLFFLLAAVSLAGSPLRLVAQSTPPGGSADEVLAKLEADAAAQHKGILLQFGASWCGNCRRFDRFLNDPAIAPIMGRAFVFGEMATGEKAKDTRHANLPGGEKLQDSLGGKDAGWPFIVMLDDHGELLAGSVRVGKAGNIGYPASSDEIAYFVSMLRRAAPSLSPQDLATVQGWLKAHGA